MKGSHNVDLIREILSSDAVMEHFLYKHGKFILEQPKETGKKKDKKQEWTSKSLYENLILLPKPTSISDYIFGRLLLPTLYGNMRPKEKAYLAVALSNKLNEEIKTEDMQVLIGFIISQIFFLKDKKLTEVRDEANDIHILMST